MGVLTMAVACIFDITSLVGGLHPGTTTGWMTATEIIFSIVLKQTMVLEEVFLADLAPRHFEGRQITAEHNL